MNVRKYESFHFRYLTSKQSEQVGYKSKYKMVGVLPIRIVYPVQHEK